MIAFDNVADHVVVARAGGELTRDDIRSFVNEIDARLKRHDKIGVVFEATEFDGMTLGAMAEDLRSEMAYLGAWDRFPNIALVAEEGFLKGAAETFGALLPQVEVETFEPEQRQAAIAFARKAGTDGRAGP